ncbi:hypothetical protein nbrc107697_03650 [Gordonia crocea]|uniref:Terminal beta-(1->2)-arabinofuranosyltransferase C-terminal domain-containing protein n=1 Tax=Gordonia crocea TaxID=589162 RepID=A0A7M3SUK2_9ACTN|nr:hypothetical protein [Gordonia crocea]GED96326.1 hypothetical protein nbrc107697_03650 [Gordonia crocea]
MTATSGSPAARLRSRVAYGSFLVGAIGVTAFFAIGAWQRRWIADDGLIVLRTIRNLLAGNGPVFNAGERVEANTSTAWTYLLWFFSWVTGGQLEYVALWTALIMSVAAIPLAMYGTMRLLWPAGSGAANRGLTLLLPLGAIIYITLPPARDFATSGLENGLSIFWVAGLWCLFLAWTRREAGDTRRERAAVLFLAFVAGLAPLIRPELTLLGGLVLLVLVCVRTTWWMRAGIVVAAGGLPVLYQIFRMGYYAVLVPNPAIAKDASGSKWHQGLIYVGNMFGPYVLLFPVILALVAVAWLLYARSAQRAAVAALAEAPSSGRHAKNDEAKDDDNVLDEPSTPTGIRARWDRLRGDLRRPRTAVVVVAVAGIVLSLYWIRQGGDFMHARVLLTPLFILLLPIMVIPVVLPQDARLAWRPTTSAADQIVRRKTRTTLGGAVLLGIIWIATVSWASIVNQNTLPGEGLDIGRSGIVDERRFYAVNMGNPNPVTAQDYLEFPRMRAMVEAIDKFHHEGAVLIASGDYDGWYYARLPQKMPPNTPRQVTVYFLNLGMTGMLAPLDVRVVDQMGLAYPIAAHTDRLQDGRIGHDKILPMEWVIAESGAVGRYPVLPLFLDQEVVQQAQVALTCPQTMDRIASYKAQPWTFKRFQSSLRQSFDFTGYRISRIPEYEIQRCGLTMPPRIRPK